MTAKVSKKISFLDLAMRVLEDTGRPMTIGQIWQHAQKSKLIDLLNSTGKTPCATLGAILYTNVKKPTSSFSKLGSRPSKFMLKSSAETMTAKQLESLAQSPAGLQPATKGYIEADLHPLLVWFADSHLGAYCRTVRHQKSQKKLKYQNQWIHPDIVGFSLAAQDWSQEVVKLAMNVGAFRVRFYSFELKRSLSFITLRESFFQAVSNSSWAHEGYLVAAEIQEDIEFHAELTRLSESFGIGVIRLGTTSHEDSAVLLPARVRPDIDWATVNRIAVTNPDFRQFLLSVANSVQIAEPTLNSFDPVLPDAELVGYVRKLLAK